MAVVHTVWVGQVGERGGLMFTPPPRLPLGIPIKNGKHAVHTRFPFLPSPPSLGHKEASLEERGPNLKVILGEVRTKPAVSGRCFLTLKRG